MSNQTRMIWDLTRPSRIGGQICLIVLRRMSSTQVPEDTKQDKHSVIHPSTAPLDKLKELGIAKEVIRAAASR